MIEGRRFKFPVYKDQTNPSNAGKIIETGDTVTVVIDNDGAPETTVNLVLTGVGAGGREIFWNRTVASQDYRSTDIVRVHAKHNYECPGVLNYEAEIEEAEGGNPPFGVGGITINGVTYPLNVQEPPGNDAGVDAATLQELEDKINAILMGNGTAYVSYSTGVITVQILGTSLVPSTLTTVVGGTGGTFAVI